MAINARSFGVLSGLAALALAGPAALAQENAITPALVQKSVQANVQEFIDMLALPDDSVNAADIRKNAEPA